jgi:hypothetical protein
MFKKKILIFLCLLFHLTFGLKSADFCILKQKECKGFYDRKQNYKIKCNPTKCNGKLSYDCESNICSKNESECDEYKNVDAYWKLINMIKTKDIRIAPKISEAINKIESFKKEIKDCQLKPYNFKENDFCSNGQNCFEIKKELKGFGFNYRSFITKLKIDCRCPKRQSFRCGNYCSIDSIACDYFKSINEFNFVNFKYCVNYNITSYTYMNFSLIKKNF